MTKIEINNLTVSYGNRGKDAIKDLSLTVNPKEFVSILGPSGCGKTTLLNTIAGFLKPTKGGIVINGEQVREANKNIGLVFQDHALFPWKTVSKNIELGPKMQGMEREKRNRLVKKWLQTIKLPGIENCYPSQLSGGMQQRVGIARALAINPKVLLMDEPFGSLDAQTRMQMQKLLLLIWEKKQKTVVFVTHEIDEAILLADRIVLLTKSPGRIKEEIKVNLPRPRNYETIATKKFIETKRKILKLLEEEIE